MPLFVAELDDLPVEELLPLFDDRELPPFDELEFRDVELLCDDDDEDFVELDELLGLLLLLPLVFDDNFVDDSLDDGFPSRRFVFSFTSFDAFSITVGTALIPL